MDICLNCHWDSVTVELLYCQLCCLTILIKGFPNTALNCHSCNLTWLFMPHSQCTQRIITLVIITTNPCPQLNLYFLEKTICSFLTIVQIPSPLHLAKLYLYSHILKIICYILIWTSWYSSWLWSLLLISSSRTKPPHTAPVECEHLEEWDNYYQSIFVISTILFWEAGWGRWLLPVIPTIKWSLMTAKVGNFT